MHHLCCMQRRAWFKRLTAQFAHVRMAVAKGIIHLGNRTNQRTILIAKPKTHGIKPHVQKPRLRQKQDPIARNTSIFKLRARPRNTLSSIPRTTVITIPDGQQVKPIA